MMQMGKLLLLGGLLAAAGAALAAAQSVVEAVQMPAWLDRSGQARPLALGTEVRSGDRLRTGFAGRARLRLADGSTVGLGQGATLVFHSRSLRPEKHFRAALDLAQGAVRYTTGAVERGGGDRELEIRVGGISARTGGADLWGKAEAERDQLCLIDGRIEARHAGETRDMEEALGLVAAPRGGALLPPVRVDPLQLGNWLGETEMPAGGGAARRGGKWKLILGSPEEEAAALALYDQARDAGYAARIRPRAAATSGKWIYDVMIEQLPSEREALVLAARLRADADLEATAVR